MDQAEIKTHLSVISDAAEDSKLAALVSVQSSNNKREAHS
jgi:hypothetical protein